MQKKGDVRGAKELLLRAQKSKPESADELLTIATALDTLGDHVAARQSFSEGLLLNPAEADIVLSMPENVRELQSKKVSKP